MPRFSLILATFWLWLQLVSALTDSPELVRVPRHVWDTDMVKRADDATSIVLSDHEKFVWASSEEANKKAVVVSMVAYSKQDERILDMDKFAFALESASCNANDMSFKFKHKIIYLAAKVAWQWVNFNDLRSFVLVPSWKGCGNDKSHEPWVVRSVVFDDKNQKVILDATQSTWKKVMNTFVLDFGEVVLGGNGKRDIIPDLDEKFRLNVGATLPSEIFKWKVNKGVLNSTLTANCNECGTSGTLIFAGHVEASLGWSGFDIDKFEITVKPENVQAHVGLSLEFLGQLDFTGFVRPSREFEILEIPVSGWNIKGIFEFGPRILLNAGYAIDYIEGEASVSTGITAKIPNTAIAKLDLLAEDSVQVSGWAPVIETDPLETVAQVNAQARIYTEIALSVSISILDDNGFGVDLALKVPEVTVKTSGGYNSNGFCETSTNPWGVMIEASVGANLGLEGWKELNGDKDQLFGVELFRKDDLYVFPQFCFAFDGVSDGFCLAEESDEEAIEGNLNVASRRDANTDHSLVSRQNPDNGRQDVHPTCDSAKNYPVHVLTYPRPADMRDNENVPIAVPSIPCAKTAGPCEPKSGDVTIVLEDDDGNGGNQRSRVERDNKDWFLTVKQKRWDAEHIYEGNWLAQYIDHLSELDGFNAAEGECHAHIHQFWDASLDLTGLTPPNGAPAPKTYMEGMLQHLGTTFTFEKTMAILRMTENSLKFRMFVPSNPRTALFAHFEKDEDEKKIPNNHDRRSCDLGRLVSVCKYYNHPEIQKRARASVVGIESVLKVMDADKEEVTRPGAGFSFEEAHADFYNKTYYAGIEYARKSLKEYAQLMTTDTTALGKLPQDVQDQVNELAGGSDAVLKEYCPDTPRDGW